MTTQERAVTLDHLSELDKNMYQSVMNFYMLDGYDYSLQPSQNYDNCEEHLEIGKKIGVLMDKQFIELRTEQGLDVEDTVTILPLRGGLGLENGQSPIENQRFLPIEIKRNGPEAQIFYPDEEVISNALSNDSMIRIKDFGIATGGTAIELARNCINLGIEPRKIVIQGAVGTRYAREAIAELSPEITVAYAVEGRMQIEDDFLNGEGDTIVDYLNQVRNFAASQTLGHNAYYLNQVSPNGGLPQFRDVTPKDWGDSMFTSMSDEGLINTFVEKLDTLLVSNGQQSHFDLAALKNHYITKFIDTP